MKIGDIVLNHTLCTEDPCGRRALVNGRCVYLHPERRFYVVAFEIGGHTLRETYYFQSRKGDTDANNISDKSQGRRRKNHHDG